MNWFQEFLARIASILGSVSKTDLELVGVDLAALARKAREQSDHLAKVSAEDKAEAEKAFEESKAAYEEAIRVAEAALEDAEEDHDYVVDRANRDSEKAARLGRLAGRLG